MRGLFRLRSLVACLSVAAALMLVAQSADARAGGGFGLGSRGMRTFTPPAVTRTAPTAAAPIERTMTTPGIGAGPTAAAPGGLFGRPGGLFGGRLFGGGLLGGLAAGFLGAGLFGMLFGGSFMGGVGGFAGFLGLLLQIGLVVIVARLVWAWWQRRNQPAFAAAGGPAGGPALRDVSLNGQGPHVASGGSGAPAGFGSNNIDVTPADYSAFERLLGEIQGAYGAEDLAALRAHLTPEMLSYFSEELAKNASRGVVNQISDVKLLQGDLAEAWREDNAEYATVAMRYALKDRMVDRATGRVVEGDAEHPQEVTELWTFRRAPGRDWLLSAIQQT
jgi:predicted lipid-binding transport protein (Tim44 family)